MVMSNCRGCIFNSVFLYLQTHQLCRLIRCYRWKRFYCSTGWCERVFLILKAIVYTSRPICHIVQELIKRNWYRIKQHSYIWRCLATFSFSRRFLLFFKQISTEIDTIIKHEDSASILAFSILRSRAISTLHRRTCLRNDENSDEDEDNESYL